MASRLVYKVSIISGSMPPEYQPYRGRAFTAHGWWTKKSTIIPIANNTESHQSAKMSLSDEQVSKQEWLIEFSN